VIPDDIYEQAIAFRDIYIISKPLSKKVSVPKGYPLPASEKKFVYSIPQALATQIAFSNELLLKAILLTCTNRMFKGHELGKLLKELDPRYITLIKEYLYANGLKLDAWQNVMKSSNNIYKVARYGYEGSNFKIDLKTLQLLNEVLDDIYNK
jgi:hypothetical protein